MATEAEKLLQELEQKYTAEDMLSDLESKYTKPESQKGGLVDTLVRNIAQPFNEGLLAIPEMLPGGSSLRQSSDALGMTAPEGSAPENFVSDSMEILGGAAMPAGGLASLGRQAATKLAPVVRGPMQEFLVQASKPGAMVGELMAAFGAGAGGQVAEEISDSPDAKIAGQLVGGMTPAAATMAAKPAGKAAAYGAEKLADMVEKTPVVGSAVRVGRDILEGAKGAASPYYRAAKEVQNRVIDPLQAAANIDETSPMPPARQVGEPRLLALDESLRKRSSPAAEAKIEKHIQTAIDDAKTTAIDVGGDVTLPRREIISRATKTIEDAENALAQVDPGASPADLSAEARNKLVAAQTAARNAEAAAWSEVGFDATGNYQNTTDAVADILKETGRATRKIAVPAEVMDELRAAGYTLDDGGRLVLADDAPETTLRDIHALRQVVQGQKGAAQLDPEKRGTVHWLTKLEDALLKDMEAVNADPTKLAEARKTTLDLYDRFRRGKVGEVLGFSERSRQAVDPRDTLDRIFSGKEVARDVEQMLKAAPESRQEAENYVRALFMNGAVRDEKVNKTLAATLIRNLERKRIFEIFPNLKDDFTKAMETGELAESLAIPGEQLSVGSKKSLAAMFLDEMPGQETDLLLNVDKVRNPAQKARQLVTRMNGNEGAKEGLRQSFRQSLWRNSMVTKSGIKKPSAAKFTELVNSHIDTMKALEFPKEHIDNMKRLATLMRQAELKTRPQDRTDETLTDIPGMIINRVSRIAGARVGNWMNRILGGQGASSAGVSLQSAQMGAGTTAQLAGALRIDPAERLLLDAMDDPSLMKALLLRDNAPEAVKKEAAARLNAWAIGVGLEDEEEGRQEPP